MIEDARVLQDDFLPKEVVHRHREMEQLAGALEPVVDGDTPQNAVLVGPSGSGKTCIARYALDTLHEQYLDIETQYVDCWQNSSRFRVLLEILRTVGPTYDIHRTSPHDELLSRLEGLETPYVVVLDEVDQLADKSLLRELYGLPNLTMVLIANDEDHIFPPLDERLQSRLRNSVRVPFDRYRDDELQAILEDRVAWGLDPSAVTDSQLLTIAQAAEGNARDAIGILRTVARQAERDGAATITDDSIEAAIPEARREIRQKSVERLNPHQRALYDIIEDTGEIAPSTLYETYQSRVDDPRTERTCRTYITKLEQYNLIEAEGETRSRVYRPLVGSE